MTAPAKASLSFLPWVRQGAAAAITTPDARTATQAGFASVDITLKVNDLTVPNTVSVRLRGPADVTGIDSHQVLRADPLAGTSDFESNCFPSIEFDRPDFPWLFTPAAANGNSQLRPWLCLIVVRKQTGVSLKSAGPTPLPMLEITTPASSAAELPDPMESWAWAHAQVAADVSSSDPNIRASNVKGAIDGASELSLSRLIAPRALVANTDYIACVVPTFELGRKTGLGLPTADSNPLAPAWSNPPPATVQLPVYYSWEFRTGAGGDFKSLATNLKSDVPNGLGQRPVSIAAPGFSWTADAATAPQVMLEGALQPLVVNAARPVLWADKNAPLFEGALAAIVNQAGTLQTATPGADPLLAPPLYARWHAARNSVNVGASAWFDELNLDPRWRSAAALGTRVVQQHQEALMASAWEQAAEAQVANQRMRQLQLSMAVGDSLHRRHLKSIADQATAQGGYNEEMLLRFSAPAFSRLRVAGQGNPVGSTVAAQVVGSRLPMPATSAAMRRVGRHRGPYSRRIAAQGFTRPADQAWVGFKRQADQSWVARLNYATGNARPALAPTVAASIAALPTPQALANTQWNSSFRVYAENIPPAALAAVTLLPPDWDYPGRFRAAAFAHLSKIRPAPTTTAAAKPALAPAAATVLDIMRPRNAHAKLARALVTTASNVLAPNGTGATAVGGEAVMMVPSFQQPMYEPLQELSSSLLLPGLDTVKPETVLGLKTNRAFMEAYMAGLNFEMGRELLWRDFPTDQRGTYFKNFWGYDAAAPASGTTDQWDPDDIDDLLKWGTRALGVGPAGTATDQFVLLLRSALLRRYPNALLYLTPVLNGEPSNQDSDYKMPIFNGSNPPDVSFFGFPISAATAIGNGTTSGYFVIIQEHPTEARFGMDANILPGNTPYFSATTAPTGAPANWGKNAAVMASLTRRLPVRIAIRASQLIAH